MDAMNINNQSRSFGYWLKAADRLRATALQEALGAAGVGRREWRLLRAVDKAAAQKHPLPERKLGRLLALGWIEKKDDAWVLTEDGLLVKERLNLVAEGVQSRIEDTVSADDLETTQNTLEQIARTLGWEEGTRLPGMIGRGHRDHRGQLGHRGGWGRRQDNFGAHQQCFSEHHSGHPGRNGHESRGRRGGSGSQRFERLTRMMQDSYERGFDAGLSRDRVA